MTKEEKYVITRLCANILAYSEWYEAGTEIKDLIDWVEASNEKKILNDKIRILTGEYTRLDGDYRNKKQLKDIMRYAGRRMSGTRNSRI